MGCIWVTFFFLSIQKALRVQYNSEALGRKLEKARAPHSSTLAWKIPWAEEPGRLQSMGSLRVEHDWATSLSLFTFMHWRRKWQPTPVFLPGESQGQGSLVSCRLWGRTESDRLKWLSSRQEVMVHGYATTQRVKNRVRKLICQGKSLVRLDVAI